MPIYRIRRHSGEKGGSNYCAHADVIARSKKNALKAAKENRIRNWRQTDTWDQSDKNYLYYEYQRIVSADEAKRAERPLPVRLKRIEEKVKKLDDVKGISITVDGRLAMVNLWIRSPKLEEQIKDILYRVVKEIYFRYNNPC